MEVPKAQTAKVVATSEESVIHLFMAYSRAVVDIGMIKVILHSSQLGPSVKDLVST